MSPRAAARLEALSFSQVYDYVAGKADWLASGLSTERAEPAAPRAGEVARRDVPTCSPGESLADVRRRVSATGWSECIVVDAEGIVLGRLGRKALAEKPDATAPGTGSNRGSGADVTVESVMDPGPGTIRPSTALEEIVKRLKDRDLERALVTTSDGGLVGVLRLEDAEARHRQDRQS
jgi:CBS domain-containing protein